MDIPGLAPEKRQKGINYDAGRHIADNSPLVKAAGVDKSEETWDSRNHPTSDSVAGLDESGETKLWLCSPFG